MNQLPLSVHFQADGQNRPLGTLRALADGPISFEYDPSFLEVALPVSPFTLPVTPGQHVPPPDFGPLFGLFADSLTDAPDTQPPFQRLDSLGDRAPGALSYGSCELRTPEQAWRNISPVAYAYALMAKTAGIAVPETQRAETGFAMRYIDRSGAVWHHVQRFGNLIHSRDCDYECLLRSTRTLTDQEEDVEGVLRLMIFNILAHNRDDHPQSITFRMAADGSWRLAPATQLSFAAGAGHRMRIAGQRQSITEAHIQHAAASAGIAATRASSIIDQVAFAIADWPQFAADAALSEETTQAIAQAFPQLPWG